ncbi:MAG: hypothetical protein SFW65_10545 [Alphaproteobacteria bacterium]|nr:hypothetical protein [Alphaproteobacteria bacterium]
MSDNFSIDEVKNFFKAENLNAFFQPDNLRAFVNRAWNGELPLWQAFWGLTVFPNVCLNLLVKLIAAIIPIPVFLSLLGIVTFIITVPLTVLQIVAVWRSAVNYNAANPNVYWGYAAQAVMAIGGVMLTIGLVGVVFHR